MRKLFTLILIAGLFLAGSAFADKAGDAYNQAHECYTNLQTNTEMQRLRENWTSCISQFELVAKKHARHDRGADARYSLGRLYSELAEQSKNQADWLKAAGEYETFTRQYSRNSMADDAHFNTAKIYWERLQKKDEAIKNLSKIIKFYKDSDRAGEAKKYMESIEAGIIPKEPSTKDSPKPLSIVIDPGHGGTDTGAMGGGGTNEKDITLAISKVLASKIKKEIKNVNIFLTRSNDETLSLNDRTKFANSKKADLFISIHANASESKKQKGIQTYYLNNATDEAAERLAKQENTNAGRPASDLEKIIATMIQNDSAEQSAELARVVHKNLIGSLSGKYKGVVDQNVRTALFFVLVGTKCPSILVETSYISNKKEEARLKNKAYQESIASAVSKGVEKYLRQQKAMAANL